MTRAAANISDFGMDTISLSGALPKKLEAIRDAGFSQVMISAKDLSSHADGIPAAIDAVRQSGLRVTGFQVLRDFEGLSDNLHDYKIDVAKSMLEMCAALGADVLLVSSSTSTHATGDPEIIARDLRKLAMLAIPLGIDIAYEALSWGRHVNEFTQAFDAVMRADAPNLGLALDSFHLLATKTPFEMIDLIDPDKVFLVQLSDFMWHEIRSVEERMATARTFRVFPGEGAHSDQVAALVTQLDQIGYSGDYSFEVFNEDYQQMPLATVAARAHGAAMWLAEDVLKRSVPLPGQMRLQRRPAPMSGAVGMENAE